MNFSNLFEGFKARLSSIIPDKEYVASVKEYLSAKTDPVKEYIRDVINVSCTESDEEIQDFKDKYASKKASTDGVLLRADDYLLVSFHDLQDGYETIADDIDASADDIILHCRNEANETIDITLADASEMLSEQTVAAQVQIEALENVFSQSMEDIEGGLNDAVTSVSDFVNVVKNKVTGAANSAEYYATYYASIISSPYLSIREKVTAILAPIPGTDEAIGEPVDLSKAFINVNVDNYSGTSPFVAFVNGIDAHIPYVGQAVSAVITVLQAIGKASIEAIKYIIFGVVSGVKSLWDWATFAPIIKDNKRGDKYINVPLFQGVELLSNIVNMKVPSFHKDTGYIPGSINVDGTIPAYRWFGYSSALDCANFLANKLSSKSYLDIPFGGLLVRLWLNDASTGEVGIVVYLGFSPDQFNVPSSTQNISIQHNQIQDVLPISNLNIDLAGVDTSFTTPEVDDVSKIKKCLANSIRSLTSSWLTYSKCFARTDVDFSEFIQPTIINSGYSTATPFDLSSVQTAGSAGFCSLFKAMYPFGTISVENDIEGSPVYGTYSEWFLTDRMTAFIKGADTTPLSLLNALYADPVDSDHYWTNNAKSVFFYLLPVLYGMWKDSSEYVPYMTGQTSQVTTRYEVADNAYYTGRIKTIAVAILATAAVVATVVLGVKVAQGLKSSVQRLTAEQWALYTQVGEMSRISNPTLYDEKINRLVKVQRRLNFLERFMGNASSSTGSILTTLTDKYTGSINNVSASSSSDQFALISQVKDLIKA